MVQASFDTATAGSRCSPAPTRRRSSRRSSRIDEVDVLGLNCAFGPNELTETVRYIAENWPRLVSALPNAGLPIMVDGKSHFPMGPADFTKGMMRFVEEFGVNIVGGCCGTMPEHLKMLCDAVGADRPPKPRARRRQAAGVEPDTAPRTSARTTAISSSPSGPTPTARGSSSGCCRPRTGTGWCRWPATRCATARTCSTSASTSSAATASRDMHEVVRRYVSSQARVPLMLDSTNPAVMEAGPEAGRRAVHPQLDEPRGRRGEARPHLRHGPRSTARPWSPGTIDEDKLNAMARTARAEDLHRQAHPRPGREQVRPARRGHHVRPAGAADQHRHRGRPPQRAGDDRGHAAHLAATAQVPHRRRPVQRQLRPQARGPRGAQQRVPARAARGGPDRRDRPRLEDPAARTASPTSSGTRRWT